MIHSYGCGILSLRNQWLGLIKLRNVLRQNTYQEQGGLRRFVSGKGVLLWKIIHHPYGPVDAFKLYQNWHVLTRQL